jgi:predicted nuclease of predicted toxin-antitoxin system
MKFLIDMNLSPAWCEVFARRGIEAVHWTSIGRTDAEDEEVFGWAQMHGYIVFTNDLDFGEILASTRSSSPSVFQLRMQRLLPRDAERVVFAALEQFSPMLVEGALVVVDESRARVRALPL